MTFLQAVGQVEGFNLQGSRAQRNNNPGNLNFEPWLSHLYGAVLETPLKGETARFARFKTSQDGWSALKTLVLKDYLGKTVPQFVKMFAPSSENDVLAYVRDLYKLTEFSAVTVLTENNIG